MRLPATQGKTNKQAHYIPYELGILLQLGAVQPSSTVRS